MDPTERIRERFAISNQVNAEAAARQAGPIASAAQTIVGSLLSGGKVLCCGNGSSAADAQYFAAHMQHRFLRKRPGLPALALSADATTLTAIALDEGFEQVFAKQVSALGHPGDVLLTLSVTGTAANVATAVDAAQERQLTLVALTGCDGGQLAARLRTGDVEVRTPSDDPAVILENHRLVLHCLLDSIDLQLMGG